MPIAGAPRTASTRIASATSSADPQRSSTTSPRQPALVEHDDRVVVESDDLLGRELHTASLRSVVLGERPRRGRGALVLRARCERDRGD